jgi:hypothetical protein
MPVTNQTIPGSGAQVPQQVLAEKRTRSVPPEIDDNVVARPLQMPEFEHFVPVDPSMEFRLVNFKVGDKESGLRFEQMKAAGYVVASPADVKNLAKTYVTTDGKIIVGDVILMKIKKSLIDGAKKWNWERAQRRRGRSLNREAQRGADADLRSSGAPRSQLNKISTFVPNADELGALVGSDKDTKT